MTQSDQSVSREPTDVHNIYPQTLLQLRGWQVLTPTTDELGRIVKPANRIQVQLMVDSMLLEQASGRTLGEALMHLGALMTGETLLPVNRIRPFLEPPR